MEEDTEGFYIPVIDKNACIKCSLCIKVCPQNNKIKLNDPICVYAAWNTDNNIRKNSTSGGAFLGFARHIVENGGIVFGAFLDDTFDLYHSNSIKKDIISFSGSKYFQSKINNSFSEVKEMLRKGKEVLFSGTPCQIAGLHEYLENDYNNLFTLDIICHGVTSRKVFLKHLKDKGYIKNLKSVRFRDKKKGGWLESVRMVYNFGIKKKVEKYFWFDEFLSLYLNGNCFRQCCYSCQFAQINRCADITMGDFWGLELSNFKYNYDDGVSLLLVNTPKGKKLLDRSKDNITIYERSKEEAVNGNSNLQRPSDSSRRNDFFKNIDKNIKYLSRHYSFPYVVIMKNRLKFTIKYFFIDILGRETVRKIVYLIKKGWRG
jgi:coenzyme F420-reducing hydrogenase beta subunit